MFSSYPEIVRKLLGTTGRAQGYLFLSNIRPSESYIVYNQIILATSDGRRGGRTDG